MPLGKKHATHSADIQHHSAKQLISFATGGTWTLRLSHRTLRKALPGRQGYHCGTQCTLCNTRARPLLNLPPPPPPPAAVQVADVSHSGEGQVQYTSRTPPPHFEIIPELRGILTMGGLGCAPKGMLEPCQRSVVVPWFFPAPALPHDRAGGNLQPNVELQGKVGGSEEVNREKRFQGQSMERGEGFWLSYRR